MEIITVITISTEDTESTGRPRGRLVSSAHVEVIEPDLRVYLKPQENILSSLQLTN